MKKSVKIIIAVAVVFVALFAGAVAFLHSHSFFKYAVSPEITSVELTDSNPISLKAVKRYYEQNKSFAEENGEEVTFHLNDSFTEHRLKVTLSDGRALDLSGLDFTFDVDAVHEIRIYAYVKYNECIEAENQGKTTVPVYIEAELLKGNSRYHCVNSYETVAEKQITASSVEYIKPLFDTELTVKGREYNLEEKKFEIKYADGTVKTVSPVKTKDGYPVSNYDYEMYTLDGKTMLFNEQGNGDSYTLEVGFFDESVTMNIKSYYDEGDRPYEKIEITDCTFGQGNEIDKLSFAITKADGTIENYTVAYPENDLLYVPVVGFLDGYCIRADVIEAPATKKFPTGELFIYINVDEYLLSDHKDFPAPEKISLTDMYPFDIYGADFFAAIQGLFN